MTLRHADRVRQTTSTTGTGAYDLDGAAPAGFQGFVAGIGDGNQCYYSITDGTDWETGRGTVDDAAPDTLTRDEILGSSNSGNAVSWGAGDKEIFCALPASRFGRPVTRTHTGAGDVTVGPDDEIIFIAQDTPAPVDVIFPPAADRVDGRSVTVKDVNGVAGTHNITFVFDGAEECDGEGITLSVNFDGATVWAHPEGTGWTRLDR